MDDFDDLLAAIEVELCSEVSDEEHAVDSAIPAELVAYVRSICRKEWVAKEVLERAVAHVLRRIRHDSPAARHARWIKRWHPAEQARTKGLLGRLRDDVLAINHVGEVSEHTRFTTAPAFLAGSKPDKAGRLVVDDPQMVTPSIGITSYLEHTPPRVLAWVRQTWVRERIGELPDGVSLNETLEPRIWDLTAGSGTGADYFGGIYGSAIVSSDIIIGPEGVQLADCRDVGLLVEHRGAGRHAVVKPGNVVRKPDLILFDPPSRGRRTHSELYQGSRPRLDLALLRREEWLIAIAFTVAEAVRHLAPGGFLSVLLRCGSRNQGQVVEDPAALEDLKLILSGRVRITHEMPIVFGKRRSQVSLGQARVPAVHLRIEAPR
ncbi:MAG: hypothetical protein WDO69_33605 [Pseudomonadota bacterium]